MLFLRVEQEFFDSLGLRLAARYEKVDNFSSLDPKFHSSYNPIDQITLRISRGTSFTMPSMAQMYSSDINLGSVRDLEG